jgi:hypothetical protein
MKPLTDSERRTLRLAGIGLAVYLPLFLGMKVIQWGGRLRADYDALSTTARTLRVQVQPYEARAVRLGKLMDRYQLDPGKLSTNTVVGDASAAIQRAAMTGGLQLGPIRESVSTTTDKAAGAIQFDATGQAAGVLKFVAGIGALGFPVIVESVQFSEAPRGPGMVKVHLSLIILDYGQWKPREAGRV